MLYDIKDDNSLKKACKVINSGGIIIYPTDTLYGFGVDATNSNAIKSLNNIKKRKQAYSIIVDSKTMLSRYANLSNINSFEIAQYLLGPYTMIFNKKRSDLSELICLKLKTIGIRMPNHSFPLNIVRMINKPIVTTSVNIHNQIALNNLNEIQKQFNDIDIFFDKELNHHSLGSTIIDCTIKPFTVLRKGDGLYKS